MTRAFFHRLGTVVFASRHTLEFLSKTLLNDPYFLLAVDTLQKHPQRARGLNSTLRVFAVRSVLLFLLSYKTPLIRDVPPEDPEYAAPRNTKPEISQGPKFFPSFHFLISDEVPRLN